MLEVMDIDFRPIHEDNRRFPNDAHLKSKFWICKNELYFNLRSYPMKAEVKAE